MSSINEVILTAKNIIRDPRNWIKGQTQRYNPTAPGGVQYCATGACREAAARLGTSPEAVTDALAEASYNRHSQDIISVNDADETTHEDVLLLFDDAIARNRSN